MIENRKTPNYIFAQKIESALKQKEKYFSPSHHMDSNTPFNSEISLDDQLKIFEELRSQNKLCKEKIITDLQEQIKTEMGNQRKHF
jgi:hypothetical protein